MENFAKNSKSEAEFSAAPKMQNAKMLKTFAAEQSRTEPERSVRQCIKIFEKCTDTQHTTVWECVWVSVCVCEYVYEGVYSHILLLSNQSVAGKNNRAMGCILVACGKQGQGQCPRPGKSCEK